MRRISIRNKIVRWAGLCMFGALGIVVAYSSITTRAIALDSATQSIFSMAKEDADEIAVVIGGALDTSRTLANALSTTKSAGVGLTRSIVDSMLRTTLERNPDFVGVYTAWEPDAFDGKDARFVNSPGSDSTGRYIPYWSRNKEGNVVVEPLVGYEDTTRNETGARKGDYYLLPRETKRECIIEPYIYPVQGKPTLMTSLVVPIMAGGTHFGLAGTDLPLDFLVSLVDKEDVFHQTGRVFIVSHKGLIAAANANSGIIGKPLKAAFGVAWEEYLEAVQGAQEVVKTVEGMVTAFAPISLGQTGTPWSVIIQVPAKEVLASASTMMWRQIGLGFLFAAVVLVGLWVIAGAIARPIGRTVEIAELIARGEIAGAKQAIPALDRNRASGSSADASSNQDETGQLLNAISTMTSNLASLLEQVQKACAQLVSASIEIAATSNQQEATVGEFEASTERVLTAVNEITAVRQELARTMEGVQAAAEGTRQLADTGRTGLGNMEGTMRQLAEATSSISSKLSVISQKTGNINSVVTTIAKVADQTNLLSLNAAIEAEKAGEYGLGFAVVAREIRRLADQTEVATLDIETMVKEMQSSVTAGVMEMDKFSEEVRRGVRTVEEISGQLGQIIEKVKEVTGQFEKVNDGTREQAHRADQIKEAMVQLSEGAKQTSQSVKQSNEATEQLREAARALQAEMARFQL